jgi:hypothetical protein
MISYIGPGMSGGLIAVIIAIILSFFTFIAAIFYYPVKKIIKIFKKKFLR